jgi:hypothetical protein
LRAFALLFDAAVVFVVWRLVLFLRRPRPSPVDNWRPSADERSGRRVTLFVRPKNWRV